METYNLHQTTKDFLQQAAIPLFVDGKWVSSTQSIPVEDPATSDTIATTCLGSAEDIDYAVKTAKNAFIPWSSLSPEVRSAKLNKLAELMDRDAQILGELETLDVGKPLEAALGFDVPFGADCFRYFAELAKSASYDVDLNLSTTDSETIKRPYGVAAFVFPWNFPLTLCAWGIAPALAAGNTVVVKPASETPLATMYLAKLIEEADFPAGTVNFIPGTGAEAGEALINHPDIKLMSFTGSTVVGKRVGEVCGKNLVPAKLELGGKGAAVVCKDADLDKTAEGLAGAISLNAGQVCCTATRWYIHESIYDTLITKVTERLSKVRVGAGMDAGTEMGPMCTQKQLTKVLNCIADAQAQGARVVTGGRRLSGPGYFMEPTLLAGDDDNRWAQEEIFGPVAFLLKFSDEDEVIERANRNPYGLANSVWTEDSTRARKLAKTLVAGNSWINAHNVFEYGLPYGACNQSGCGGGVNSPQTYEGYLRSQSVASVR